MSFSWWDFLYHFILKETILFIFRYHFSVMIFFKLFPLISFAYSKVKPLKLRNFLIFFPFCLSSTCQVWYFQSLSLWHAISHESCSRVFLIHSQSFHFFHLKGQCHKIFCFNDTGSKLPPVSTTLAVNLLPRCQWHRWQIMGTISDFWHLKVNLKKKIIYMLTLLPKGGQKNFSDFSHWSFFYLSPVSTTPVVHLEPEMMILMGYSEAWEVENLVARSLESIWKWSIFVN